MIKYPHHRYTSLARKSSDTTLQVIFPLNSAQNAVIYKSPYPTQTYNIIITQLLCYMLRNKSNIIALCAH